MTLILGTVGLFDLRLLGVADGLSPQAMHRLVRWGVAGFMLNVVTGAMFFAGIPTQYIYNGAFQAKMLCLAALGFNILLFYVIAYEKVRRIRPGEAAPAAAKLFAATSLLLWIAVVCFGRAEAFFKP
jgi:hypothetical protein